VGQTTKSTRQKTHAYEPRIGYALAASAYEKWHWFQFWRKNEVQIVRQWATALTPGKILDAGSGTGLYRPVLESAGHWVVGADLSTEMLMIQARRNPTASVVQARIEALPFQAPAFDYILCTRVLSHVQTLMPVFREFARVTRQEARLLITDVHPEHRYSEMSIPTNEERVSIQTYKHPIAEIKTALETGGFELLGFDEFRLHDLAWKPPVENFENIYDETERPIFYTAFLGRP
jgi:ubiquinone/menaquinone biosynthesis C-methylase UbiE